MILAVLISAIAILHQQSSDNKSVDYTKKAERGTRKYVLLCRIVKLAYSFPGC